MQKRPYLNAYSPVALPKDFPLECSSLFEQTDRPITQLHLHDCLEIGYCHEGSGLFVVEEKVMAYRAGDISIINDQELHLAQSLKGTVSRWTWVMVDPLRLVEAPVKDQHLLRIDTLGGLAFTNILSGRRHPDLAEWVRTLIREYHNQAAGYRSAIRALVWMIMVRLHRIVKDAPAPPATKRDRFRHLAPALEYMVAECSQPLRMKTLADRCHMSVTNFRRAFRAATGKSPLRYLTHVRLRMATVLLQRTDRKILDVAMEAGFPSLSSFNRQFKTELGMTPRHWRHREKKLAE